MVELKLKWSGLLQGETTQISVQFCFSLCRLVVVPLLHVCSLGVTQRFGKFIRKIWSLLSVISLLLEFPSSFPVALLAPKLDLWFTKSARPGIFGQILSSLSLQMGAGPQAKNCMSADSSHFCLLLLMLLHLHVTAFQFPPELAVVVCERIGLMETYWAT